MIFIEDREVKVSGVVLPGILKSIEIKGDAIVEEQEVEGSASKGKQATGYEDMKVNIELVIDDTETQTKYQRLTLLQNMFRKAGQKVPEVQTIVSEDTSIRGVSQVIFKSLSHKKENKKGQIPVTLEFWEYNPIVITAIKGGGAGTTGSGAVGDPLMSGYKDYLKNDRGTAPTAAADPLMSGYKDYLKRYGGTAPKLDASPAVDDAPTAADINALQQMPYG